LNVAVVVGLGRFAYSLILPAMKESFARIHFEAGALKAVNLAGYLIGLLYAGPGVGTLLSEAIVPPLLVDGSSA